MKIKAIANVDNNKIRCVGEIKLNLISGNQVYIIWSLLHEDKLIAAKSETLYYRTSGNNEENLMKIIVEKIKRYRIGRKRIFEEVEVVS
jgi:predicted transcriptional regulator